MAVPLIRPRAGATRIELEDRGGGFDEVFARNEPLGGVDARDDGGTDCGGRDAGGREPGGSDAGP